ncbi:MAG: hypothetical protein AABX29_02385 [Nanoarchaeota archaeon]
MAIKKIKITMGKLEKSFREDKKFFSNLDKGIIKKHTPTINFENFDIYKKILTPKRLELLKFIKSKKPKTIKALSIEINRDFKNVYDDVKLLESVGLIELKKSDLGLVPVTIYDEIEMNIRIPLEVVSN